MSQDTGTNPARGRRAGPAHGGDCVTAENNRVTAEGTGPAGAPGKRSDLRRDVGVKKV